MSDTLIGYTPQGCAVFASKELLAEVGRDSVQCELVDRAWLRRGIDPPGYYRVRTHPFRDDYVLVKADSHEAAVNKYLRRAT